MPHVFRSPGESAFASLARTLGNEFQAITLYAPSDKLPGWHEAEQGRGPRFRWSCNEAIVWPLSAQSAHKRTIQARIPFLMESRPHFASECRVTIGGRSATVNVRDGAIYAELDDVPPNDIELVMQTPDPRRPADLGESSDFRKLGLAFPIES
jgi:hypothetical protein